MATNPCADAVTTGNGYPPPPSTLDGWETLAQQLATNSKTVLQNALQTAGGNTCTTKSQQSITGAFVGIAGAANAEASSSSVGCSSVAIAAQLQNSLNSTITCDLNQNSSIQQNNTIQSNQISILVGQFDGDNFTISATQSNTDSQTVYDFTSSNVQTQIKNSMNSVVQSANGVNQNSSNGDMASPSAQKSIQNQINQMATLSNGDVIDSTVSKVCNQLTQGNKFQILLDEVFCNNFNIDISQVNVNNYVIQQIVQSVMASTFSQTSATFSALTDTTAQSQSNKGFDSLISSVTSGFTVIAILFWLAVVGLLGGAGFFLYKIISKGVDKASIGGILGTNSGGETGGAGADNQAALAREIRMIPRVPVVA